MLREFEQRLADVLGAALPAPIAGSVDVAPGDAESQVLVSVRKADPDHGDFRSVRPEQVPGATGRRRVVRLKCDVALEIRTIQIQTRGDRIAAMDLLLFFIDDPAFQSGRLLDGGAPDPGFLIQSMTLRTVEVPGIVSLDVNGLFWPVGAPGASGDPIQQIIARLASLPLRLDPPAPLLVSGGPQLDLSIRLGTANAMDILADDTNPRDFGGLLLRITDAGGRPGAGTLTGGDDEGNGVQRFTVADGSVGFQYTPPDQPGTDILHVAYENQEIAQIPLRTRSA